MFKNIGKKIKILAQVFFWIGLVGSVIAGIVMLSEEQIPLGLLILFGGFILSWISNFFIYGFGELVEKVTNIESALKNPGQVKAEEAKKVAERKAELDAMLKQGLITEEDYNKMPL